MLQPLGLRFELQLPWWHLHEAAELADLFPETQIILVHAALPADRSAEGMASWKKGVAMLAERANVVAKVSGMGIKGRPWVAADHRDVVLAMIETFGVDRCMFASNFPVDSLCGDLDTIFSGYKEITAELGPEAQAKLFHDNAVRIYDIA